MTTESEVAIETGAMAPQPQEKLSFFGKFWNLFVDPRKTFSAIGGGHEWIILWLIVGAVSLGGYMPIKDIVKADRLAQIEQTMANNPNIPAEQRQEIIDQTAQSFDNPVWVLLTPVFQLVAIMIVSAVLLFIGNIILGGNTKFLPVLNAYAWTGMLTILGTLVVVPLIVAKGSMDVSLGLGILTGPDTGPFMKKLLTSFELFGLWQVWLCAVAVSVLAKATVGKAFGAVFAAWFIWVLAQSGLATLGMNFGM